MKIIDNWKHLLPTNLRQQVIDTVGQARPRDWPAVTAVESNEYRLAAQAGYDLHAINWWIFEESNIGKLSLPFEKYHWWITKLYPGQFMPMHTDPHTHEDDCIRLWVPLQDYMPGHIFIYKNEFVKDYKAFDVYQYDQSQDYHGAANIGHSPRVILQVTVYET